ncbi:hypothetical protein V6O07_07095, partial [Arthrospira platensis SPKY2]
RSSDLHSSVPNENQSHKTTQSPQHQRCEINSIARQGYEKITISPKRQRCAIPLNPSALLNFSQLNQQPATSQQATIKELTRTINYLRKNHDDSVPLFQLNQQPATSQLATIKELTRTINYLRKNHDDSV